jgi:hypothetical protein
LQASASALTTVAQGASSANGAWVELIAATTGTSQWLLLNIGYSPTATTAGGYSVSIGIGAAAAEVVVVSGIQLGHLFGDSILLPLRIQAGSRVSCRSSSVQGGTPPALTVAAQTLLAAAGDPRQSPSSLLAIGVTTNSLGTSITSNDTYVEIEDATTQALQGVVPMIGFNDSALGGSTETVTWAVGASGAEVVLRTVLVSPNASEQVSSRSMRVPVMRAIPASSRLAAKIATGGTNGGDVTFLGIPYT